MNGKSEKRRNKEDGEKTVKNSEEPFYFFI
jgi:hypothetical protein